MYITKTVESGIEYYNSPLGEFRLEGLEVFNDAWAYRADAFESKECALRFIFSWLIPMEVQ